MFARSLVFVVFAFGAASAAQAQVFQGNWACGRDGIKAGILTIYGPSYGFASATFGDPLSGTGAVEGYADGVAFKDGPLVSAGGLSAARLVQGEGALTMQLESQTAIEMICTQR